ncbi:hypothetical protein NDA07_10490 [Microcoleus vaginatus DQ-U2]|uniref:hypothetical protein n=1 Tax=Microcoleus vaginatus TaxID=119532 RepID=UPI001684AC9D|nr:hypothetical protein [Microcoleus sp. FACHB-DQ6]
MLTLTREFGTKNIKEEGERMRDCCTFGFFYLYFLRSRDVAASGDPVEAVVKKIDRLLE